MASVIGASPRGPDGMLVQRMDFRHGQPGRRSSRCTARRVVGQRAYVASKFDVADGAALPLEDASVDAVVLHTVLCHVSRPAVLS